MIYGHLHDARVPHLLQAHSALLEGIAFLKTLTPDSPLGIVELRGPKMYVNVHAYETRPTADCGWEAHRHTIDIQFVVRGAESIGFVAGQAGEISRYDPDKDFEIQTRPSDAWENQLTLTGSEFVIFLPGESHSPQRAHGPSQRIVKAVVKVDASLL